MHSSKRLRAPLIMMFAMIMATMAFAGPANAADSVYPPSAPTQVLGTSASSSSLVPTQLVPTQVAGVSASGSEASASELAFTGANAIGIGAFGALLLVGGAILVSGSRRRKTDA